MTYSQAQDVFLLVGLITYPNMPKVAIGWTRNGD
jgi:DNA helicase-2/ATP-dependent DNA helicase PcrA